MSRMSESKLEQLKRLHEKASPGPWRQWAGQGWPKWWLDYFRKENGEEGEATLDDENAGLGWPIASAEDMERVDGFPTRVMAMTRDSNDQAYIVAVHGALPGLLRCVEAARELIDALEGKPWAMVPSEADSLAAALSALDEGAE